MQDEGCFERAIAEIESVVLESELRGAIQRTIEAYGLEYFAYCAIRLSHGGPLHPVLIVNCPQRWITSCHEHNAPILDPVVAAGARSILPVDWSDLERAPISHHGRLDGAGESRATARGLTFPVRGPDGDHALFAIACSQTSEIWHRQRWHYMRDFHLIACLVHAKVKQIWSADHAGATPRMLSPRERECLELAALGRTNKDIARELKISERVVRAYFETARAKLKCKNRSHVVGRAVSLGAIHSA